MRALATIALCLLLPGLPAAEPMQGVAVVIDGDTLELGDATIRLHGIDAPEAGQSCYDASDRRYSCGREASRALRELITGRLSCNPVTRDRYGRIVAVCRTDRAELNREMVAAGWALAFRRYSTAYVVDEDVARTARRGLWAGRFQKPWDWRAVRRDAIPLKPRADAGRDCRIKGNVSRNGRIYHMPGSEWYARTRISPARGERWFCSEAEARAAGWRAARD